MANPHRLALFTAALRSGRFAQGKGKLTRNPGTPDERHCCLGVACVVAMENGLQLSYLDAVDGLRYYLRDLWDGEGGEPDEGDYGNDTVLPQIVAKWYGFGEYELDPDIQVTYRTPDGTMIEDRLGATTANDGLGFTFAQIADAFDNTFLDTFPDGPLEP